MKEALVMEYKVGQKVSINVYSEKGSKFKRVLISDPTGPYEQISSEILGKTRPYADGPMLYMVEIPDDVSGWKLGPWSIEYQGVPASNLNKRFYEVHDYHINWSPEFKEEIELSLDDKDVEIISESKSKPPPLPLPVSNNA